MAVSVQREQVDCSLINHKPNQPSSESSATQKPLKAGLQLTLIIVFGRFCARCSKAKGFGTVGRYSFSTALLLTSPYTISMDIHSCPEVSHPPKCPAAWSNPSAECRRRRQRGCARSGDGAGRVGDTNGINRSGGSVGWVVSLGWSLRGG